MVMLTFPLTSFISLCGHHPWLFCGLVDLSGHSPAVRPGLLGRTRVGGGWNVVSLVLLCFAGMLCFKQVAMMPMMIAPSQPRHQPLSKHSHGEAHWGPLLICFGESPSAFQMWRAQPVNGVQGAPGALPWWWPCDAPAQEWGCILRGVLKRAYAASGGVFCGAQSEAEPINFKDNSIR